MLDSVSCFQSELRVFSRKTASWPLNCNNLTPLCILSSLTLFHLQLAPIHAPIQPPSHSAPHSLKQSVSTGEVCRSVFGGSNTNRLTFTCQNTLNEPLTAFEFKEHQESKSTALKLVGQNESQGTDSHTEGFKGCFK